MFYDDIAHVEYSDFRPPELRNDNRSPETHGQNKSTGCLVSIVIVGINSTSFPLADMYTPYLGTYVPPLAQDH